MVYFPIKININNNHALYCQMLKVKVDGHSISLFLLCLPALDNADELRSTFCGTCCRKNISNSAGIKQRFSFYTTYPSQIKIHILVYCPCFYLHNYFSSLYCSTVNTSRFIVLAYHWNLTVNAGLFRFFMWHLWVFELARTFTFSFNQFWEIKCLF
jgi:hypothetical protein